MINKKLSLKNKTVKPFLMQPFCKEALWGGQRLQHDFGKTAALDNIAETWECSTHPDGPSTLLILFLPIAYLCVHYIIS